MKVFFDTNVYVAEALLGQPTAAAVAIGGPHDAANRSNYPTTTTNCGVAGLGVRRVLLLCAGLLTPHRCSTEGLLPSKRALKARMPLKPRPTMSAGDLRSGTPAVVRPAPNTRL